jgi:hypothetical protein
MALNQIERRLLIEARKIIAEGGERQLCYAIDAARFDLRMSGPECNVQPLKDACNRLRNFVMTAIDGCWQMDDWVHTASKRRKVPTHKEMITVRLTWIDWLLDEPWTDWSGGACPLLDGEHVIIRLRNGQEMGHDGQRRADTVRWFNAVDMPGFADWATNHDVVAYKVIYEAPKC